jgi:hypothetical protein
MVIVCRLVAAALAFTCTHSVAATLSGPTGDGAWTIDAAFTDEQGHEVTALQLRPNVLYRAEVEVGAAAVSGGCPARIAFNATMPAHYHGMATSAKVSGSDCRYLVSGIFMQMSGVWELYFDVARGVVVSRATFPIELRK